MYTCAWYFSGIHVNVYIKYEEVSNMATTIVEIARKCDVSWPTVSRILNGKENLFLPKTVMKVKEAAKKLGYRPNAMAKAARNGCFGQIGLIFCSGEAYLPDSLMRGIQEEVAKHGLSLVVSWISKDVFLNEKRLPKILTELMVDGLLIDYLHPPPEQILKMTKSSRTPALLINTDLEFDSLRPDDRQAGREATRHLIAMGHRRIGYVFLNEDSLGKSSAHYSVRHRYDGYCEAMSEAGLEPRLILGNKALRKMADRRKGTPQEIAPWLFEKNRPTAIVVNPGAYGFPTIFRAIDAAGLSIPKDLSIVTFENHPCIFDGFTLTTMVEPFHEIGKAAVSALIDKIKGNTEPLKSMEFPFKLVQGLSCAKIDL